MELLVLAALIAASSAAALNDVVGNKACVRDAVVGIAAAVIPMTEEAARALKEKAIFDEMVKDIETVHIDFMKFIVEPEAAQVTEAPILAKELSAKAAALPLELRKIPYTPDINYLYIRAVGIASDLGIVDRDLTAAIASCSLKKEK